MKLFYVQATAIYGNGDSDKDRELYDMGIFSSYQNAIKSIMEDLREDYTEKEINTYLTKSTYSDERKYFYVSMPETEQVCGSFYEIYVIELDKWWV